MHTSETCLHKGENPSETIDIMTVKEYDFEPHTSAMTKRSFCTFSKEGVETILIRLYVHIASDVAQVPQMNCFTSKHEARYGYLDLFSVSMSQDVG